jgi:hypothetical protein
VKYRDTPDIDATDNCLAAAIHQNCGLLIRKGVTLLFCIERLPGGYEYPTAAFSMSLLQFDVGPYLPNCGSGIPETSLCLVACLIPVCGLENLHPLSKFPKEL